MDPGHRDGFLARKRPRKARPSGVSRASPEKKGVVHDEDSPWKPKRQRLGGGSVCMEEEDEPPYASSSSSKDTGSCLELRAFDVSLKMDARESDIETLIAEGHVPASGVEGLRGLAGRGVVTTRRRNQLHAAADLICDSSGLISSAAQIVLQYVPTAPYFGRATLSLFLVLGRLHACREELRAEENRVLLGYLQQMSPRFPKDLSKYLRSVKPANTLEPPPPPPPPSRGLQPDEGEDTDEVRRRRRQQETLLDRIFRTKLHGYQLETVRFVQRVERQVRGGVRQSIPLSAFKPAGFGRSPLSVDWPGNRVVLDEDIQRQAEQYTFKIAGGVVANEVGLGKSLTALSIILLDTRPGVHLRSPPAPQPSATAMALAPEKELGELKVEPTSRRIRTDATLVLCPSHVVSQWRQQLELHVRPEVFAALRVACVTSREDLQRHFRKFPSCDVVIASVQALGTTATHRKAFSQEWLDEHARQIASSPENFDYIPNRELRWLHESKRSASVAFMTPVLGAFFWKRVVVDEFHELFSEKALAGCHMRTFDALHAIRSTYRLVLTATPFPDTFFAPRGVLRYLLHTNIFSREATDLQVLRSKAKESSARAAAVPNSVLHTPIGAHLDQWMFEAMYCRFRQVDAGWELPPRNEHIVLVAMHPIEKLIFDLCASGLEGFTVPGGLSQLCAHPLVNTAVGGEVLAKINNTKVLDKRLFAKRRKDLVRVKWNLAGVLRKVVTKVLRTERDLRKRATKKAAEIRALKKKMSSLKPKNRRNGDADFRHTFAERCEMSQVIKGIQHQWDWLQSQAAALKDFASKARLLLPSGDIFGSLAHLRAKKRVLVERSICRRFNQIAPTRTHWRWRHFGSKISCLLDILQGILATSPSKVIIFTQHARLFSCISLALEQAGVPFAPLKGNVKARNKSVKAFKNKDACATRVMLLSLDNTASGLDLIEATHVILLDQPTGTADERASVEAQAIGRVHRQGQNKVIDVFRLAMVGTEEERLVSVETLAGENLVSRTQRTWTLPRRSRQWNAMGYDGMFPAVSTSH